VNEADFIKGWVSAAIGFVMFFFPLMLGIGIGYALWGLR
jgi:hypothetical protein